MFEMWFVWVQLEWCGCTLLLQDECSRTEAVACAELATQPFCGPIVVSGAGNVYEHSCGAARLSGHPCSPEFVAAT